MREEKIKILERELKYLTEDERKKELELNKNKLENENIDIKEIVNEIYLNRGLDISKIKKGIFESFGDSLNEMISLFKNKDKKIRNKMIVEIFYMIILLVLIKIPFDLVRDIGYEYIELFSTNSIISILWNLSFLVLYTITIVCSFIVFVKNFNKKYRNTSY